MPRAPRKTVVFGGKQRFLVDLCREYGIHPDTVRYRLRVGMPIDRALTQKPRQYVKRRDWQRAVGEGMPAAPASTVGDRSGLIELVSEAVSLLVDAREIILSVESSVRRERVLSSIRGWLLRAGWR